mmetsp:Transcript_35260/g.113583  ORF Transcript_35260/g.113583 Transcript_35260/m.113583 type:complete len:213 (+) Transcript_35260:1215-1853(+)
MPRRDVVREDGEGVVGPLVTNVVEGLGEVAHHDALGGDDVDGLYEGWQVLELGLSQQLLGAHLVDAQAVADADQGATAEGSDGGRHVLHLRLVDERERGVSVCELVHTQESASHRARVESHVLDGPHNDKRLPPALAQRHRRHRHGGLVVGQLEHGQGLLGLWVQHTQAAGPLAWSSAGDTHHRLHQHALGLVVVGENGAGRQRRGDARSLV